MSVESGEQSADHDQAQPGPEQPPDRAEDEGQAADQEAQHDDADGYPGHRTPMERLIVPGAGGRDVAVSARFHPSAGPDVHPHLVRHWRRSSSRPPVPRRRGGQPPLGRAGTATAGTYCGGKPRPVRIRPPGMRAGGRHVLLPRLDTPRARPGHARTRQRSGVTPGRGMQAAVTGAGLPRAARRCGQLFRIVDVASRDREPWCRCDVLRSARFRPGSSRAARFRCVSRLP